MSASVIILPVIRTEERAEGVLVQANLDPKAHAKLRKLADRYWRGDLQLCASELLHRAVLENTRGGLR